VIEIEKDGIWTRYGVAIPSGQANGSTALRIVQDGSGLGNYYLDLVTVELGAGPPGVFATGQTLALSLESFTASAGVSPVYRAVVLRGALRPKSTDQITAVVRIADNMRDRQGGTMRSAATMLTELRALAQSNSPTTLLDLTGAASYVNVIAPIEEQEAYQQGSEEPELMATVKMSVLTFS
jgi:hypothetical protein